MSHGHIKERIKNCVIDLFFIDLDNVVFIKFITSDNQIIYIVIYKGEISEISQDDFDNNYSDHIRTLIK